MAGKWLTKLLPRQWQVSLQVARILRDGFGHARSVQTMSSVDRDGKPIPWYTYPAIEYLKQLDLSRKRVFEYGSGNSTLFWAERCQSIVAVEDDEQWYDKVKRSMPSNAECLLCVDQSEYVESINRFEDQFDVIIVDGSHRYECARTSREKLSADGFMILDNSDWKEQTASALRDSDLIEVDFSGFGPINPYTWTTSFFLTRNVDLRPAHDRQPIHGIGSLPHRELSDERQPG